MQIASDSLIYTWYELEQASIDRSKDRGEAGRGEPDFDFVDLVCLLGSALDVLLMCADEITRAK